MTATTTPLPAGIDVGETLGGKLFGRNLIAKADGTAIDPATSQAQAAILAQVQAAVAALGALSGGGGDASAANQTAEIAKLEAVRLLLAGTLAISAASLPLPTGAATGAKQDASQTTLAAILAKLIDAPATAAKQDAAIAGNAPFGGRVAMTVGTAVAAGRAIEIVASAAGNVSLTFADGSTTVVAVAAGTTILDYAVTTVNASGTTATATYGKLI